MGQKPRSIAGWLAVRLIFVVLLLAAGVPGSARGHGSKSEAQVSPIDIDYPEEGSVFPRDIYPPTFRWRDANPAATIWLVQVVFAERGPHIKVWSEGERLQVGEIDTNLHGFVPPTLTPQEAASHTWRPDVKTWAAIVQHARQRPAAVIFTGFPDRKTREPASRGQVNITISPDPVGAPIFYRDVPLIPPRPEETERGVIKPLPDSVLPMIKWRLRNVSEPRSRVVMENLPTCANCHSVSADGKTLGIDVDGPQNDKALYGLIPIHKVSSIEEKYVIRWSAFTEKGSPKRFGFMSQVSPTGKYVVTSIEVPGTRGRRVDDRIYQGFYKYFGFGQVFYPTRGILAWYSRETGKLQPLPGADDPKYVQTGAFWGPDDKFVVFSRAVARSPYSPGQKASEFANDPNETQIQYDLYRVEFNDGKGSAPERIAGASENGMSNDFPKVSPDGKWIVFVQNKTGLLMRPDSKLYIVPAAGGVARPLRSNQPVMNSWHSFSPNGRWLVFSSKYPSPYTRLYLTHIDAEGNSTPAIAVENSTAANRAVNIPEFVNVAPDGLERIDAPAAEFYRLFDVAVQLATKKEYAAAVPAWRNALALSPDDARAHNNLGVALAETGKAAEAIAEYRRSLELDAGSSQTNNNLGSVLAEEGKMGEATALFERALELDPENPRAHMNLGSALAENGRLAEAIEHLRRGVEIEPDAADGQNNLGAALARSGALDEALAHLEKAVALDPQNVEYRYNLARTLAAKARFVDAANQLEEGARLSQMREPIILQLLAAMYSETGRYAEALATARKALALATGQQNQALAAALRDDIAHYEGLAPQAPAAEHH
ncbi:MAG TPA: tetratricopeptide repeat protein [Bryobacteraceae bacterium]|nr:tetratricopeptide repeat protein [Bryobacteraceae bacterium]